MNEKQARQLLQMADVDEPAFSPPAVFQKLDINDVQDGCGTQVGVSKENVHYLGWSGTIMRRYWSNLSR